MEHLRIVFREPFSSFGTTAIDGHIRPTEHFPTQSMLVGLIANSLGWDRSQWEFHNHLMERLIYSARIDQEAATGAPLTDFQIAQLNPDDRAWTTRRYTERRTGGGAEKAVRRRQFLADTVVSVALRLEPEQDELDLWDVAQYLQHPYRPLFIGRKAHLAGPLDLEFTQGESTLDALLNSPLEPDEPQERLRVMWPSHEPTDPRVRVNRTKLIHDVYNWKTNLHTGNREVCEGVIIQ